jgi:hypothetical protein
LDNLSPIPLLFYNGYLTLDNLAINRMENTDTMKSAIDKRYPFMFPNHEVESWYRSNYIRITLGLESPGELAAWCGEFRQGFLDREAKTISDKLNLLLPDSAFYQKIDDDMTFHAFVNSLLRGMGFKVLSEAPGAEGLVGISIELSGKVFGFIELKFCHGPAEPTEEDLNPALAAEAMANLPKPEIDEQLAFEVLMKLSTAGVKQIRYNLPQESSLDEINARFAQEAETILSPAERHRALASLAREKFGKKAVNKILADAANKLKPPKEQIDAMLSDAAQEALEQIGEKDCHGPFKLQAKEFIDG